MNIASLGQATPAGITQSTTHYQQFNSIDKESNAPESTKSAVGRQDTSTPFYPKGKYDFTNISPNELQELYLSGNLGEKKLVPIPLFPTGSSDTADRIQQQRNDFTHTKMDIIGFLKGRIDFGKNIGANTDLNQNFLTELLHLQGESIASPIDTYA